MTKRAEKRSRSIRPLLETLERRAMLSTVPFSEPIPISQTPAVNGYFADRMTVGDMNRDGINDLLVPKLNAQGRPRTAWRINNGDGTFGPEQEIGSTVIVTDYVDMDADGDLDIFGRLDHDYVWWENTIDETGSFQAEANFISTDRIDTDASGDFNSDGLIDFVKWSSESTLVNESQFIRTYTYEFAILQNTDAGFVDEPIVEISGDARLTKVEYLDIDSDADLDVLLIFHESAILVRNSGDGSTSAELSFDEPEVLDWQPVSIADPTVRTVANQWQVADMDEDGDPDLVQNTLRKVVWAENVDGQLQEATTLTMPDRLWLHSIEFQADMDGDGVAQPVYQIGRQYAWFEAFPQVDSLRLSEDVTGTLTHGDIDGDADIDFVSVVGNNVRWHDSITEENATAHVIQQTDLERGNDLVAVDIDGDGDLDPALESRGVLIWYENLGNGEFGSIREVAPVNPANWMLDDFDGDGLTDVITWKNTEDGRSTYLHSNAGDGRFGGSVLISSTRWSALVDIDGDRDLDLFSQSESTVYLNDNGTLTSSKEVPFQEWDLEAVDIDGDSDLDIVGFNWENFVWYENLGDGEYLRNVVVASDDPLDFVNNIRYADYSLSDINNDGDLDLLLENENRFSDSSLSQSANSRLFEFEDGSFVETSELRTLRYADVQAVDLDSDGKSDFISIHSNSHTVEWHENLGDLQFQDARTIPVDSSEVVFADLDGDQKPDLLTIVRGETLQWQQNQVEGKLTAPPSSEAIDRIFEAIRRGVYDEELDWNDDGVVSQPDVAHYLEEVVGTKYGDLNLDGQVDFADFLVISSNFGTDEAGWVDGDLDGDGEVGFADFLEMSAIFRNVGATSLGS